ncbi:electron transfer flavoprotein subunit alpha/FixB family protein [Amycolatopsis alkalitolerans]|uniref:Electron transfer flavoprotein subunit alpha/FixB family protein n=1 Tax=Amycolatopsis alkalitolerans TaxID=2547244 RepID=A0A5C4M3T4_9PSEU|nr:electron transfer flavoprotein subunit alpha/FixB family protein [Amycolatopsis alkalitolerans]TNC25824.1 electron transfer flavoprotein subunit alpha/FixB family protein [Amycolatopsis alkalitolerans]
MSNDVLVLAEHVGGQISESTYELLGKAKELAAAWGGKAEVALFGPAELASWLDGADTVVSIDHPALADYTCEGYETALRSVLAERSPRLVLLSNATVGLDLGAALSVLWDAPLAAYVGGLWAHGDSLVATCQVMGGKIMAEVELTAERAVCTVLAGAFPAAHGQEASHHHEVVSAAAPEALETLQTNLARVIEPEGGDVNITDADLLVSVGRGIDSQDNLELVQELADTLGVPLSASRPIIDSGWLPKTRQVGKSGLKVKPKAYLAFGISGAPEHLEGMRDAELIIACNTDENAPIFEVAHYGTTEDLFDLVPTLVDKIKE